MAVTQIVRATQIKPGSAYRVVTNDSTGAMADAAAITALRALQSDANGIPTHSVTTATELSYVNGVTSAIQTQLDAKATRALDNLTSTAINTSLISDTDNTDDLGTAAINWKDVHAKRLISSTGLTLTSGTGTIVLNPTTVTDASAKRITNVADPTAAQDAATKNYVDTVVSGLDPKQSVRLATNVALPANTSAGSGVGKTLTADANGALSVDGVAVVASDRILVKNETPASDNGIYTVTATGSAGTPYVLTRSTDTDGSPAGEVTAGMFTFVEEGSVWSDTGWVLSTNNPITVDTTSLVFTQFSSAGVIIAGAGLLQTGNTIDIVTADDSMTINADSIQVKRDPAGAIGLTASGIKANTDGTSIEISSNNLRIASGAAGTGLGYSAGVLSVNLLSTGGLEFSGDDIQIKTDTTTANTIGVTHTANGAGVLFNSTSFTDSGSETLALNSSVAGDALTLTSGVLHVVVDNSTIEINTDALRLKDDGITYAKTRIVTREVPTGLINGSNVTFTLAFSAASGSEHVYLNGILQNVGGGNDYTISGATITFNAAPMTGSVLLVTYWKA